MEFDFEAIKKDLERLRLVKRKPNIFGADSHGYVLNPPMSESAVRKFEAKYDIRLPQDYRQFLIQVGNGGAGPYYGVFKLGEMDDGWGYAKWKENDSLVGDLSKPFPHNEPWNNLSGELDDDEEDEEEYERQLTTFEEHYWNPENINGAIPICHLGCASRQWLVVTGAEAGHVWCDGRADRRGLYPLLRENSKRATFYQWYRDWLDEALSKLLRD